MRAAPLMETFSPWGGLNSSIHLALHSSVPLYFPFIYEVIGAGASLAYILVGDKYGHDLVLLVCPNVDSKQHVSVRI